MARQDQGDWRVTSSEKIGVVEEASNTQVKRKVTQD
jgi:hypothetical protein